MWNAGLMPPKTTLHIQLHVEKLLKIGGETAITSLVRAPMPNPTCGVDYSRRGRYAYTTSVPKMGWEARASSLPFLHLCCLDSGGTMRPNELILEVDRSQ